MARQIHWSLTPDTEALFLETTAIMTRALRRTPTRDEALRILSTVFLEDQVQGRLDSMLSRMRVDGRIRA